MRNALLLSTALTACLLMATPVHAETPKPQEGFYGSFALGLAANNDADLDFGTGTTASINIDNDLALAGAIGYRFTPWLRVEGEIGHFGGDLDSNNASMSAMTYMANAYVDWQNSSRFTPYAGFGLGVATISTDVNTTSTFGGSSYTWVSDDTDAAFAWQIGAGVSYQITDNWAADLGWRYLDTSDVTLDTTLAGSAAPVKTSLSSNIIRLGARMSF